MDNKILVLGAKGQLGQALLSIQPAGLNVTYAGRAECDLTDAVAVAGFMNKIQPTVIINCAAYTAVDKAEEEIDACFGINCGAVQNIANCCTGRRLIHISTDFVFDGQKTTPYLPEDTPAPLGVYGKSKLAGERAALQSIPEQVMIIRTAWLYGTVGSNFVKTMMRLMTEKDELSVVCDQRGSPTFTRGLADVIWRVIIQDCFAAGIYHWTDSGNITWHEFAAAIQEGAIAKGLLSGKIPIKPILADEYQTLACRPAYSVMDTSKLENLVGHCVTPWRDHLDDMLSETCAL